VPAFARVIGVTIVAVAVAVADCARMAAVKTNIIIDNARSFFMLLNSGFTIGIHFNSLNQFGLYDFSS
jgi:hypothetical protein